MLSLIFTSSIEYRLNFWKSSFQYAMPSFKSFVFQHILTLFLKVVVTICIVVFTYVVFLYRIPLQSLFPLLVNPACSWHSVTTACSIQNRTISSCSLILIGTFHQTAPRSFQRTMTIIVSFTFSHLWTFFQSFYNNLLGKIMCETLTSAVHNFGRCLKFYQACVLYSYSFRR